MACDFGQQETHALEGCGFRRLQLQKSAARSTGHGTEYIYTAVYAVLSWRREERHGMLNFISVSLRIDIIEMSNSACKQRWMGIGYVVFGEHTSCSSSSLSVDVFGT